jgi:hypothetical protein
MPSGNPAVAFLCNSRPKTDDTVGQMKAEIAEARGNERKTETEKNFRGEKRFGVDSIDMFFFLNKSSFQFLQEQTFAL